MERRAPVNWGKVQAITLDAGGTLIEPWPSVGHVYARTAARHGYALSPEVLNDRFARAWKNKQGFDYTRPAWSALVDQTFAGLLDGGMAPTFFDDLYREFESPEAWRIYDEVRPVLESLRRDGLKLAVISNWDDRLRPLLERMELSPFFDAILVSAEVGYSKPDAGFFHKAAVALNLPPPAILHVGDSLEEDYRGAQAAGFEALLLNRSTTRVIDGAISSLSFLATYTGLHSRVYRKASRLRVCRASRPVVRLFTQLETVIVVIRERAYCGSMTFKPGTTSKCRLLNVATSLPRSIAVAATIRS